MNATKNAIIRVRDTSNVNVNQGIPYYAEIVSHEGKDFMLFGLSDTAHAGRVRRVVLDAVLSLAETDCIGESCIEGAVYAYMRNTEFDVVVGLIEYNADMPFIGYPVLLALARLDSRLYAIANRLLCAYPALLRAPSQDWYALSVSWKKKVSARMVVLDIAELSDEAFVTKYSTNSAQITGYMDNGFMNNTDAVRAFVVGYLFDRMTREEIDEEVLDVHNDVSLLRAFQILGNYVTNATQTTPFPIWAEGHEAYSMLASHVVYMRHGSEPRIRREIDEFKWSTAATLASHVWEATAEVDPVSAAAPAEASQTVTKEDLTHEGF